jgi:hypothetical protein
MAVCTSPKHYHTYDVCATPCGYAPQRIMAVSAVLKGSARAIMTGGLGFVVWGLGWV